MTRGNTLRIHGSLYLFAASCSSGLLAYSTERMLSISTGAWSPLCAASMFCALTVVVVCGLVLCRRKTRVLWNARVSATILAGLLC